MRVKCAMCGCDHTLLDEQAADYREGDEFFCDTCWVVFDADNRIAPDNDDSAPFVDAIFIDRD